MKKNVIRLLFALVALLTSTSMLAENKLWIASEGDGKFAIMMDCDANAAALQFNLQLPEALSIVKVDKGEKEQYIYRNPERFSNGQQIRSTLVNGNEHEVLCLIVSMTGETFIGEQGTPIAYFETEKDATSTWNQEDLKLTDIIFSTANGTQLPAEEESVYDGAVYGELVAYFDVDNLVINPESSKVKVPVAVKNSFNISGLQMDIVLPEGFTMENEFEHTDRIATTAQLKTLNNGNVYSFVLTDIIDNKSILQGDGTIFYIFVNSPAEADFTSNVEFKIEKFGASTYDGEFVAGKGMTLDVINGGIALKTATDAIEALESSLASTLATIAEECPDVADRYTGDYITQSITALKDAVQEAYDNLTLTADYETIMAPVPEIQASIYDLLTSAKAAQEAEENRVALNKTAYEATVAAIDQLQENLDNTVAIIDAEYPDFKDEEAIEMVQGKIDLAREQAEAAYEAVTNVGDYSYDLDEAGINSAIDGLVLAAEAAKDAAEAEAARKAANEAAYNAVLADLEAVKTHYGDVVTEISSDYPEFKDETAETAVWDEIVAAEAVAKAAFEAVANEGTYDYKVDVEGLNASIDALLQAAKDAKDKSEVDAETARQEANKVAYEADMTALDELNDLYRIRVAEIQADYKAYENVSDELAVRNKLDAVKAEVEKAYKAVANEGVYSYDLDVDGLTASINKLLDDAKAAAEAAEAARQARNEAAYNAVMDQIKDLRAEEDNAIDKILAEYPNYNMTLEVREIDAAITAAENAADAAYAAVATEGEFDFTFDADAIRAMIQKMLDSAEADGVEAIEAEVEAGNAYIFTLDGKQHIRPVHGEVNIVVRKNGEKTKLYVK